MTDVDSNFFTSADAIADPQARRTQAFDALRETLQRLGDRHTVVLFLDDMQWVDRDNTALLADLMRAPDPPPVLLVLATRTEGAEPVVDLVRRMDAAQRLVDHWFQTDCQQAQPG